MDKLSGDYNRGYTKALTHVLNFFDEYSDALKFNKMYNQKDIHIVLNFLLDNRNELRETGTIDNVVVRKTGKQTYLEKEIATGCNMRKL